MSASTRNNPGILLGRVVECSLSYSGEKEPGRCQLIHRGDKVVSIYISSLPCLNLHLYSFYLKPFLAPNLFHLGRYYHIPIIQTRNHRVILEFPFSLIPYMQWTTKFYIAVLSNIGCQPHVATEYLKWGWTKLRCALSIKYTSDFEDVVQKRERQLSNNFYTDFLLK